MQHTDLAFYTSEELIDELLGRQTFLGIVVHSQTELKNEWQEENVFKVRFNGNLDTSEAGRLLEIVARRLDEPCC